MGIEHMINSYSFLFEGLQPDTVQPKARARTVATIPAGNPAASSTGSVPPQDRRKGFMKRKSTFFVTNHYSGNSARIQNVISLVNGSKDRDSISQAPLSHRDTVERDTIITSPEPEERKKKSKRKKSKDRDTINQDSVDVES